MELLSGTGNQGPQLLYSTFGALAEQDNSHMYPETLSSPGSRQHWSRGGKSHRLAWGEVLGRNPHGLPNQYLPFPVNHQPRCQGRPEYWGQDGGHRAEVQRETEAENATMQRRRELHVARAPIRRDGTRSQSGVGVELWGDRLYHSLPQKWCQDARLQGSQESRRIPQWVERRGNTRQQGAPCPRVYHHLRGFRQLEEKQPGISYGVSHTQKRPCMEERNSNGVIFGQLPSYVSPPPYSAPHRTLVGMQLCQK